MMKDKALPRMINRQFIGTGKQQTKGMRYAQYNLGWMYDEGQGVAQDDKQAVYWYRKAADQGNAKGSI